MGAFVSFLDFVLNFPVGKTLVEFILVVGVMCAVTDGIAKARNRGDRSSLEIPEDNDFSPDETDGALHELNSFQRSIERRDVKVEEIVESESSDKTPTINQSDNVSSRCHENDLQTDCDAFLVADNEAMTTKESDVERSPETDQTDQLGLGHGLRQEWMNQRILKCRQHACSAINKDHLNEQYTSCYTSANDDTSNGRNETTNDLMAVDTMTIDATVAINAMTIDAMTIDATVAIDASVGIDEMTIDAMTIDDVIHADRKDSNESGIYSSDDGTKSKSSIESIDSLCEWHDIDEYPTFDDKLNLLSPVCDSDEEKRRHLTDHSEDVYQTKPTSIELFHRPQSEGRSHHGMLSDDGCDDVELMKQDRDTIRLWNEMILEDNARLHDENLLLRQENEDIMRENARLKEEHMHQSQLHFQLVFVGDSGVGKTSFIRRVCEEKFSPQFNSTVGVDFQSKTMDVDGRQVVLQMWDTAGQERFRSITRQYFRKADVAVVMYDVTSEDSFMNVRLWMHDVQEGSDDATIIVVIGNKRDLAVSDVMSRKVTTTDGAELAKFFNAPFFYETSAKTGEDVSSLLHDIVRLLIERNQLNCRHSIHSIVRLDKSRQQPTKTNCCGGNVRPSTPEVKFS